MSFKTITPLLFLSLLTLSLSQSNTDGSIPDSAAADVNPILIPNPRTTIYAYLTGTGASQYKVLAAALASIGLDDELNETSGRFTLFAPTDNAFADLARRLMPGINLDQSDTAAVVDALQQGIEKFRDLPEGDFLSLERLVRYHIIGEAYTYAALEPASPRETFNGRPISVINGEIVDLDAQQNVTAFTRNIFALNGWVHAIPHVLLSFSLEAAVIAAASPAPSPSGAPVAVPTPDDTGESDAPVTVAPGTDTEEGDDDTAENTAEAGLVDSGDGGDGTANPSVTLPPAGSPDEMEPSSSPEDADSVCFPASARVLRHDGKMVRMSDLVAGDHVHATEFGVVSRVFAFTHRTMKRSALFYKLATENGKSLSITGSHYLYANGRLTAAKAVAVGDVLRTVDGESRVVKRSVVKEEGLFAPHTMHGDLVVEGVVVSGYSRAVQPWLAHALFAPVRMIAAMGVNEPLGAVFYDGADRMASVMPKGRDLY